MQVQSDAAVSLDPSPPPPTPRALKRAARGMSLLEIMVVITLIGLVAAAVSVSVMGMLEKGEMDTARNQAFEIGKSIELYKLQQGSYPTTAQGLQVLAAPPRGKPFMERVPKDPWGEEYIYVIPGQKNPAKFDVRSKGPDKQEGTEDDVGNWSLED
jgi:general secretion pathway protein G